LPVRRQRFVALVDRLHHEHPDIPDPVLAITAGAVRVDGVVVTNPRGLVRRQGSITFTPTRPPRGAMKLAAALAAFDVRVRGAVAVDVGASTGGFTSVLLQHGAARVYAVDAGYGQPLGSLRQDPRVVNLERTNVGSLGPEVVPDVVDVVTMDLSYLALADAVPQLGGLRMADGAHLVALIKPMFELGLPAPPREECVLQEAVAHAAAGMAQSGWTVGSSMRSPVTGGRGAREFFLHACWLQG
jgi:23S rRNA (cytidine1920-2'-O)/16S rRNA (cytidine1409-2'-O)-methyltransferase